MLKIKDLHKRFDSFVAVDRISFDVAAGDILGFLGPNGAGKSTTMKMICGYLKPTSGSVDIYGHDIGSDAIAAKRLIGYLPEGAPTYGDMSVKDFLTFIAEVRQLNKEQTRNGMDYVIEELQIKDVLMQPIETLSKGFKRRVGLAQALIHDPKVLIMDEPTDGLDPNQKHHVRTLINSLSESKIVVISTHILEEVSAVCNRALIIAKGKLLINTTPDKLLTRSRYQNTLSLYAKDEELLTDIKTMPGIKSLEYDTLSKRWLVFVKGDEKMAVYQQLENWISSRTPDVDDLRIEHGRLDDVFRKITEGSLS
ncbi:MAG: ABC transporter ATP-binding protein [Gammaproteobacteria bacterium]|nr:ABC transporter ATP-binding protein [Gammaproteobacteria bacterium]